MQIDDIFCEYRIENEQRHRVTKFFSRLAFLRAVNVNDWCVCLCVLERLCISSHLSRHVHVLCHLTKNIDDAMVQKVISRSLNFFSFYYFRYRGPNWECNFGWMGCVSHQPVIWWGDFFFFILCSLNLCTSAVFFTWESLFWSCLSIMNRPQQQESFCAYSYDILCMSEMCRSTFISSDFIWCRVCLKLCFILAECQAIFNWFFRWWQGYFQHFLECDTESESERKK